MPWQWVTRGARLYHRRLHAIVRPVRPVGVQTEIRRRVCLAARPGRATPLAGTLSTNKLQFLFRAFATETEGPEAKKPRKKKDSSGKHKKSPKPKKKTGPKLLTDRQIKLKEAKHRRERIASLKEAALEPPKRLPTQTQSLGIQQYFGVVSREFENKGTREVLAAVSAHIKALSAGEQERLRAQAEENKATNEATYAKWLQQYTPLQIKQANTARRRLENLTQKTVRALKDDRLVKAPITAYMHFFRERARGGDFRHMAAQDIARHISGEWRAMTESEKQPFKDMQMKDRARWEQEYREVYGEEAPQYRSREVPKI